ncbi:MAG: hypothetical protein GEV09_09890 [Pseudonocardiaceae bacterium]|nr:hypothetical protein [Pseudonocardiaceae bacterium]
MTSARSAPATLSSAVAGLAVVLASTALAGVLSGGRWLGFVVVTVAVVVAAGAVLRSLRVPLPLVAAGQLAALGCLVTAVFSRSGVLAVLPGPDALGELRTVLSGAVQQIRVGVAPVAETTELLCLVVIALGLVAVLVDTLAVSAAAPAAAGLALLCVVAVPASLADELLPWWTFALGALGFALLLTVDGQRRHLVWGEDGGPAGPAGAAPGAAAVSVVAVVLSLLLGGAATGIGTDGRLPGTGGGGGGLSGIGVNPFTSLRGQLDSGAVVDLFRVRGLPERAYLRALTLSRFEDGRGWMLGSLDGAAAADGPVALPPAVGEPPPGPVVEVRIEPINYVDSWLPAFGVPLEFADVGPDWRYDSGALTAFSGQRRRAEPYTVLAVLPQPDPGQLRAAGGARGPAHIEYLDTGGVDPRVAELAARVTAGTGSPFDATVALQRFFTDPRNGFRYELQTTPGSSGDALVDFLFERRSGYCEQYASAMAIMLRTVGIPARVAVGFTPGNRTRDSRVITTEDAHAWVEAFFPGAGWLPFDPTPLVDGRGVVPPYVAAADPAPPVALPPAATEQPPVPTPEAATGPSAAAGPGGGGTGGGSGGPGIALTWLTVVTLTALAALGPATVREGRRRRRLRLVDAGGPDAATAAWEEVLAESADRGVDVVVTETVRGAARRLLREHALDDEGRAGLGSLVSALERSWYGRGEGSDPALPAALGAVRASLARCAPQARRTRLLPRSVLPDRARFPRRGGPARRDGPA